MLSLFYGARSRYLATDMKKAIIKRGITDCDRFIPEYFFKSFDKAMLEVKKVASSQGQILIVYLDEYEPCVKLLENFKHLFSQNVHLMLYK
jgi:hypothetical protein